MAICTLCDDAISGAPDIKEETLVKAGMCYECYMELKHGILPDGVTDSSLAPPHTGLCKRQRWSLKKTTGG